MQLVRRALPGQCTVQRNRHATFARCVLLLAALLLASCTQVPAPQESREQAVSVNELLKDADGDGSPDRLHEHIRVRGPLETRRKELYLAGSGHRVQLSPSLDAAAGDTVEISGRLLKSGGKLVFAFEPDPTGGSLQYEQSSTGFNKAAYVAVLSSWARTSAHVGAAVWSAIPMRGPLVLLALVGLVLGFAIFKWKPHFSISLPRRSLFQSTSEALLTLSPGLIVVDANAATGRLLGRAHLSGLKLSQLVKLPTGLDAAAVADELEHGRAVAFDATIAEDEERRLSIRLSTLAWGGRARILCLLADDTDRAAREQLTKKLQQVILDDMPFEVAVLSPQGQYVFASAALAGERSSREALIGKTDVEVCREAGLHSEVAVRRRAQRRRTVATKQVVRFEEALGTEAGERHFIRYYAPVLDRHGEVSMIVSYGLEVTEVKRLRQEVAGVTAEVEGLRRMKESFLQNLSHEFRTPLSGIMGVVQILSEELTGDQRELLDMVSRNSNRLLKTLSDVLDLAELQAEEVELNPEILNVAAEVRTLLQDVQAAADEKGLFLRLHETDTDVWARLDAACFRRALGHLVENAIKFTESGGVVVDVDADQDQVHVRVMDSGIGVDDASLGALYDEFIQGSEGMDREFEGLGIGLSLTERLIGLMEGKITAYSEKAGGTMFSVAFPRVFAKPESTAGHAPSVLVLEGDPDEQRLLRYLLDPYTRSTMITDPERIIESVTNRRCDAVLLNVDMVADLAGLVRRIRAVEGTAWTLLIGMGDPARGGDRDQYVALGLDEYLQRPLTKKVVLNALENAFTTGQALR